MRRKHNATCDTKDGTACQEEPSQWGFGFLQEKFQVMQRFEPAKDVSLAAVSSSAENADGIEPASWELLDRSLFGSRIVHFPLWVYAGFVGFYVLIFIHEAFVSNGMTPLFVSGPVHKSMGCQYMSLWNSASGFINMSMQIPISLDFALSLNQGATSSGFFLSCGVITGVLAMGAGKLLVDENNWNQFRVRRLMIIIPMINMILGFICAIFINETANSNQVYLIWWIMLGFVQIQAFVGPLTMIPGIIFWTKITSDEHRTYWMILTQCARNGGLVVGPLFFALLRTFVTGDGDRVNPRSMMGWVNLFMLFLSLISAATGCFLMPTTIPDSIPKSEGKDDIDFHATGEVKPEDLCDADRKAMVWNMIWYAFERPLTLAAVEVSTLMMLEVFYGWDPYWTGLSFTAVCSLGIVMSGFTTVMLNKGIFKESYVFMISAASSILGCLFLFEIVPTPGWMLLLADGIIYTGATVANGFAEGWASRAAKEGTSFSNAEYRLRQLTAVTASRFMGPICGRFLVDYCGRNAYAFCQILMCCLGTRTVYKTCKLIWHHQRATEQGLVKGKEEAKGNAEKLLPEKNIAGEKTSPTTQINEDRPLPKATGEEQAPEDQEGGS
ncbi:unnamed protein product [Effrenium voratum]|uniref:Uncharacterized protein n=1 Tax=Effrenium voratum TaxID=2562239 RepID=A0AA36JLU3_9DINO|nr:unnamed protein product [Effrenium voratum]